MGLRANVSLSVIRPIRRPPRSRTNRQVGWASNLNKRFISVEMTTLRVATELVLVGPGRRARPLAQELSRHVGWKFQCSSISIFAILIFANVLGYSRIKHAVQTICQAPKTTRWVPIHRAVLRPTFYSVYTLRWAKKTHTSAISRTARPRPRPRPRPRLRQRPRPPKNYRTIVAPKVEKGNI